MTHGLWIQNRLFSTVCWRKKKTNAAIAVDVPLLIILILFNWMMTKKTNHKRPRKKEMNRRWKRKPKESKKKKNQMRIGEPDDRFDDAHYYTIAHIFLKFFNLSMKFPLVIAISPYTKSLSLLKCLLYFVKYCMFINNKSNKSINRLLKSNWEFFPELFFFFSIVPTRVRNDK